MSDQSLLEKENKILKKRIEDLEKAGRTIKPYLQWTIGDESPGYHPTMPSAVGAFLSVLSGE